MKRLILGVFLLAGCALSAPFEPTVESLPWATFPEMAKGHVQSQPFRCPAVPEIDGVMGVIRHEGVTYLYFYLDTPKKRFIVARMVGQDPVMMFLGHEEKERLVVERVEPYSLSAHGDSPCKSAWLYELAV